MVEIGVPMAEIIAILTTAKEAAVTCTTSGGAANDVAFTLDCKGTKP